MNNSSDRARFEKIYLENRDRGIRLAARFIRKTSEFPSLVGLEAEGIYNEALYKYFSDGAHRNERADHWPLLHYRITQAGLDALKKAKARKRVPPGGLLPMDATNEEGEPHNDIAPPGPTDLDQALDRIAINDAHDEARIAADGNKADTSALEAAFAYDYGEQTYRDISEEHGFSDETARRRVKRGRKLLADQIQPDHSTQKDTP